MTRIIGDVHGKFDEYLRVISGVQESIQVGDFGVGFQPTPMELSMYHQYIRGNHDNPEFCKKDFHWIKDGTMRETKSGLLMLIGGARSVDQEMRTEGVDWWRDEEISYIEFNRLQTAYLSTKPQVMITHDCPLAVAQHFGFTQNVNPPSLTGQAFNSFFEMHQPNLWIFGHHHELKNEVIKGCRFICLPELAHIDVNL